MPQQVAEVIDQSLRLANRVDSAHRQRALDAIDRNLKYFAERLPWPSLRRVERFVATGDRFYTFPARVRRVISIMDRERTEHVSPGDHFEQFYAPWLKNNSSRVVGSFQWRDMGFVSTIADPRTDTLLRFQTTASEGLDVTVVGLTRDTTASGTALELVETTEVVNLGGTDVTETSNLYVEVKSLEKDSVVSSNDVLVSYSEDGSPAARINLWERSPGYNRIEWLGLPNAGDSFETWYYTRPPRVQSEGVVLDPAVEIDFLVWRTVGDLHWMNEQAQAAQAAWDKADQILQTKITSQKAHGQRVEQAVPYTSFISRDDEDFVQ